MQSRQQQQARLLCCGLQGGELLSSRAQACVSKRWRIVASDACHADGAKASWSHGQGLPSKGPLLNKQDGLCLEVPMCKGKAGK